MTRTEERLGAEPGWDEGRRETGPVSGPSTPCDHTSRPPARDFSRVRVFGPSRPKFRVVTGRIDSLNLFITIGSESNEETFPLLSRRGLKGLSPPIGFTLSLPVMGLLGPPAILSRDLRWTPMTGPPSPLPPHPLRVLRPGYPCSRRDPGSDARRGERWNPFHEVETLEGPPGQMGRSVLVSFLDQCSGDEFGRPPKDHKDLSSGSGKVEHGSKDG